MASHETSVRRNQLHVEFEVYVVVRVDHVAWVAHRDDVVLAIEPARDHEHVPTDVGEVATSINGADGPARRARCVVVPVFAP
jgi:hypothetical protein